MIALFCSFLHKILGLKLHFTAHYCGLTAIFYLSDNPGGEDLSRPVLIHSHSTLPVTATMASLPVPQISVEKPGAHPVSQPQQKTFDQALTNPQGFYQPPEQPGSQSPPQTQVPLDLTSRSLPQTQHQHKAHHHLQPTNLQTTTSLYSQLHFSSRSQTKHQVHHQTQPQEKMQSQSQLQVHLSPQTATHPQTPQPTLQHISHTHPRIHTHTKLQPQSPSSTQPQTIRHPQSKTTQDPQLTMQPQSKAQPRTLLLQTMTVPEPKGESKAQTPALPKKPWPRTWDRQQPPNVRRRPQLQPPSKIPIPHSQPFVQPKTQTQSLPEPLPKPHPASRPQPQPELQFQSQTRTFSDPNNITPGQAGSMGKNSTFCHQ